MKQGEITGRINELIILYYTSVCPSFLCFREKTNIAQLFYIIHALDFTNGKLAGFLTSEDGEYNLKDIDMKSIARMCENGSLRWTNHVLIRLLQRGITTDDVVCALRNAEIIEVIIKPERSLNDALLLMQRFIR